MKIFHIKDQKFVYGRIKSFFSNSHCFYLGWMSRILRKHIKAHFLELGFIQVLASPVTNACIFTKLQLTTRNLKNSAIIYLLLRKKNPEGG